jgi:hypothetical protein
MLLVAPHGDQVEVRGRNGSEHPCGDAGTDRSGPGGQQDQGQPQEQGRTQRGGGDDSAQKPVEASAVPRGYRILGTAGPGQQFRAPGRGFTQFLSPLWYNPRWCYSVCRFRPTNGAPTLSLLHLRIVYRRLFHEAALRTRGCPALHDGPCAPGQPPSWPRHTRQAHSAIPAAIITAATTTQCSPLRIFWVTYVSVPIRQLRVDVHRPSWRKPNSAALRISISTHQHRYSLSPTYSSHVWPGLLPPARDHPITRTNDHNTASRRPSTEWPEL